MSSFISDSEKTKDKHNKNKQPSVQTTIDHWIIIITITYHFEKTLEIKAKKSALNDNLQKTAFHL